MPKWFSVNEKYFVYIFSFNLIIIFWLYSPYYLSQFSFSSDDARSLSIFDISFKELVIVRNFCNLMLLIVPVVLNLFVSFYLYPVDRNLLYSLIILSFFSLLPAIALGNYFTVSSVRWVTNYGLSWRSVFIILIIFITDFVVKASIFMFSAWVAGIILLVLFLIYFIFYYLSFWRNVQILSMYFSSIAEK